MEAGSMKAKWKRPIPLCFSYEELQTLRYALDVLDRHLDVILDAAGRHGVRVIGDSAERDKALAAGLAARVQSSISANCGRAA
jgi:hypothetical protein